MARMVQALEGFAVATDTGRARMVPKGTILPASDPVVKQRPDLFEDLDDVVERATAAPGEKRTAKRSGRKVS